jgi:hypothetical protein
MISPISPRRFLYQKMNINRWLLRARISPDVGTTWRNFELSLTLNPTDPVAESFSDGNLYRMLRPTCLAVCILNMFLTPALIARLDDIPKTLKTISLPKIEYKPRAPSSPNFTGRRDYLTKLRAFFNAESDEPHRRKSFLLYGMGGIGKTQICLKFTEENSYL